MAFSWQCIPVNVTTALSSSERNPILFTGNRILLEVIAHLEFIQKDYTFISLCFKQFQIAILVLKFMFKPSLNSEFLRTAIRANGIPITQTGQRTDQLLELLHCDILLQYIAKPKTYFSSTLLICVLMYILTYMYS